MNKTSKQKDKVLLEQDGMIPHGVGRLVYSGINGAYVIEGQFDNGTVTGYGRWIWQDGLCYQGHLKNFKAHGEGKQILGQSYHNLVKRGKWENDKLIDGEIKFEEKQVRQEVESINFSIFMKLKKDCEKQIRKIELE